MEIYNVKVEKNGKITILAIFMTSWRKMEIDTDTFLLTNVYYYVWRTFCNKHRGPTSITNGGIPNQNFEKIHFFLENSMFLTIYDVMTHDTPITLYIFWNVFIISII